MSRMGESLTEISQRLKDSKKVQLIYAFNGTGKTRLSQVLNTLIENESDFAEDETIINRNFYYYNAFTEDLFYWDNDSVKLNIHSNIFTKWILETQGQENNIAKLFRRYTNSALTPNFNPNFSEVRFSFERGNDEAVSNVKISKGEESNFIWCIFFVLLEEIVEMLRENDGDLPQAEHLKYVFIDDPVTSLDDNHLIQLAVDLAQLIKNSIKLNIKYIITTHNPLFYNVLCNELGRSDREKEYSSNQFVKYRLEKLEDGSFLLEPHNNDSPFSYHLLLKNEIEGAIETGALRKFHFNFLRNILEKTATFLGYENSVDLLPKMENGKPDPYDIRMINISSHSKHSGEEVSVLSSEEKDSIERIFNHLISQYSFNNEVL